ncbi:hypothetical protein GALMADRAFT_229423 [Galerina marginata CBS 339.88]|uniref:Uncharacterized protein n=1 Tax=Galerina marginata (strain CBS 339.88) TaxID=685588 RepID=A0A067SXB9_GALM3|nr:hypothetical protein GALMADRAFT_229423 [Galerina marginata CBS 339.88]
MTTALRAASAASTRARRPASPVLDLSICLAHLRLTNDADVELWTLDGQLLVRRLGSCPSEVLQVCWSKGWREAFGVVRQAVAAVAGRERCKIDAGAGAGVGRASSMDGILKLWRRYGRRRSVEAL